MAEFTDRIKLVFDAVTQDATSGVGKLKSSVGEAEGGFAKLKAGAGGALGVIADNAALSAGAAGLAIGKFVADAIGHFQQLALEANNFGDAVGLSVEDASRWIEVADDLGVSVDTLQGAVGKLNIATANGVLDKLGVGGDTTNERLINALEHLQAMPDAADRAKEGMQLFGKSWTALSPLVETAGDLRQKLAAVSDAKVINEAEVAKAKELRDAMDRLSDVWDDFVLSIGGAAIQTVAEFANGLGNLAEETERLADATGGIADFGSAFSFLNPIAQLSNLAQGFQRATDFESGWINQSKGLASIVYGNIPVVNDLADSWLGVSSASDDAAWSTDALKESQKQSAEAAKAQAEATADAEKALRSLNDATLASMNSNLGLADASDRTTEAIATYTEKNDAAAQSGYGNAAANDEARRSMNDAEQAALAQAAAAAKLDSDQKTAAGSSQTLAEKNAVMANTLETIAGTLAADSPLRRDLLNYAHQLEQLPTDASTTINADTSDAEAKIAALKQSIFDVVGRIFHVRFDSSFGGSVGSGGGGGGGTLSAPTTASTGVATMAAPSTLASAAPARMALPSGSVVNNVYVSVAPFTSPAEVGRSIADYLDAFYRRSGTRARAVA
jgi:hypothetical protein